MVGEFFNLVLINPLTNLFVLLTVVLGNSGLAVIALTVIIRVVTWPLQLKQMRMTRMMAAISPRVQEINKKYKDPRRRSEEQMKLYREMGFNPLGCFGSALIQFPIFICLYSTFRLALGEAPEASLALADRLYGLDFLRTAIPLDPHFLWLNLGRPDPFVIPVTVAISTYVYQKMSSVPPTDERQAAQMNMTNMLMPLLFGWFTLTLPSGVGLYYVLSNIMGMVMQYVYVGGGAFNWRGLLGLNKEPVLPKAAEIRQQHLDAAKRAASDGDDEEPPPAGPAGKRRGQKPQPPSENGASPEPSSAGARRRRRYASGRRRGRR
jgi:YidC/Oxa1 family membrane protein insertase